MFLQINYQEVLERTKQEMINNTSFEEMEDQREKRTSNQTLSY